MCLAQPLLSRRRKTKKRVGPNTTYIYGLDTTYNDLGKLPGLIPPQSDVNSYKSKQKYECIKKLTNIQHIEASGKDMNI